MSIHVVWLSYYPNVPKRGYWDQGLWIHLFRQLQLEEVFELDQVPAGEGAIVCLPAKAHEGDVERLNRELGALPWVVLILAEDEGGDFPTDQLEHPNMRVWVQTPWPGRYKRVDQALGVYWREECPRVLAAVGRTERDLSWAFVGQVTHRRRRECSDVLAGLPGGYSRETKVFGARIDEGGLAYEDYLATMALARVVPCPSGAVNPDSFRVWEALEAGCVPVVDGQSPRIDFPLGYWDLVAPGHPFPVVDSWHEFPELLGELLADWQLQAVRCSAWWLAEKHRLRQLLEDTVLELGGGPRPRPAFTVLIPTSPIPDHPSTAHLVETVNSIRARTDAPIIISCDGIREEQLELRERYLEYLREVLRLAHHEWTDVQVIVHEEHLHQVAMARHALELVRTEAILYVEHDTPLIGEFPWAELCTALTVLDVIRFYHELQIPAEHGYLHRGVEELAGLRFERTVQWSQRPHLARADYYQGMLTSCFSEHARTFVEDKMHSVAQLRPEAHRIGIYLPDGPDIRRSYHTDGRAGAEKFDGGLIF